MHDLRYIRECGSTLYVGLACAIFLCPNYPNCYLLTIPATTMAAIRVSYAALSLSAYRVILVNSGINWVTF